SAFSRFTEALRMQMDFRFWVAMLITAVGCIAVVFYAIRMPAKAQTPCISEGSFSDFSIKVGQIGIRARDGLEGLGFLVPAAFIRSRISSWACCSSSEVIFRLRFDFGVGSLGFGVDFSNEQGLGRSRHTLRPGYRL